MYNFICIMSCWYYLYHVLLVLFVSCLVGIICIMSCWYYLYHVLLVLFVSCLVGIICIMFVGIICLWWFVGIICIGVLFVSHVHVLYYLFFCVVFLHLICPMLTVSLDCPFLITPSVFPNVYLQ